MAEQIAFPVIVARKGDAFAVYDSAGKPRGLDYLVEVANGYGALQAELDQLKEHWDRQCQHIKEALELLGVDVSVEGYVPDSWTLREQCKIARGKIDRLLSTNPSEAGNG